MRKSCYLRIIPLSEVDASEKEEWSADDFFYEWLTAWVSLTAEHKVLPNPVEIRAIVTHMRLYSQDRTRMKVTDGELQASLTSTYLHGASPELIYRLGEALGFGPKDWEEFFEDILTDTESIFRGDSHWLSMDDVAVLSQIAVRAGLSPIEYTDSRIAYPDQPE